MEKSSCDWVSLLKKTKTKKVGAEGKPATEKERECTEGKRREGGEKEVCEEWREGE